jgi:hypothetical protein
MNTLRSRTIRLAHQHPELRAHLLPILSKAASGMDAGSLAKTLKGLRGHIPFFFKLFGCEERQTQRDIYSYTERAYKRFEDALDEMEEPYEGSRLNPAWFPVTKGDTMQEVLAKLETLIDHVGNFRDSGKASVGQARKLFQDSQNGLYGLSGILGFLAKTPRV